MGALEDLPRGRRVVENAAGVEDVERYAPEERPPRRHEHPTLDIVTKGVEQVVGGPDVVLDDVGEDDPVRPLHVLQRVEPDAAAEVHHGLASRVVEAEPLTVEPASVRCLLVLGDLDLLGPGL